MKIQYDELMVPWHFDPDENLDGDMPILNSDYDYIAWVFDKDIGRFIADAPMLAARVEELTELLRQALEFIEDPDHYDPVEWGLLQNKIEEALADSQ